MGGSTVTLADTRLIFLDANIFLRHLAPSSDIFTQEMKQSASWLFASIRTGSVDATTSELVLHDVFFMLTSKRHYSLPVSDVIEMVEDLIQLRGFKFPPRVQETILEALFIWRIRNNLGFADSMIAAQCRINGWELATFDEALGSMANVQRWSPSAS